jgi:glycosyltransferase involved in cell wall biosynthesis
METDQHLLAAGRNDFRRIMSPVDEERFSRAAVSTSLRTELRISDDVPVIAFIGRLDEFKDPLSFIRACRILKERRIQFLAIIAGDGELMSLCQREIAAHGLQQHVLLLGMRSDPERLLKIASALVHISPTENTWANAIAEAMFMDVPVVMTNAGYTEHTFTDQKDCLLVPVRNPGALADALQQLLSDEDLRASLTEGARELLRTYKKDSSAIIGQTRDYYDELLIQVSQLRQGR